MTARSPVQSNLTSSSTTTQYQYTPLRSHSAATTTRKSHKHQDLARAPAVACTYKCMHACTHPPTHARTQPHHAAVTRVTTGVHGHMEAHGCWCHIACQRDAHEWQSDSPACGGTVAGRTGRQGGRVPMLVACCPTRPHSLTHQGGRQWRSRPFERSPRGGLPRDPGTRARTSALLLDNSLAASNSCCSSRRRTAPSSHLVLTSAAASGSSCYRALAASCAPATRSVLTPRGMLLGRIGGGFTRRLLQRGGEGESGGRHAFDDHRMIDGQWCI